MEYRDFQNNLEENEEYISCMMSTDIHRQLPYELKEQMYESEIRQKNEAFKNDDTHKGLVKSISKAKKALRDYEFNINNKM